MTGPTIPKARGFAAALETYLARGGGREKNGGSSKRGYRFTEGPIKGMTVEQATAKARALWRSAPESVKEKYAGMEASMLAPSEMTPTGYQGPVTMPPGQGPMTEGPARWPSPGDNDGDGILDAAEPNLAAAIGLSSNSPGARSAVTSPVRPVYQGPSVAPQREQEEPTGFVASVDLPHPWDVKGGPEARRAAARRLKEAQQREAIQETRMERLRETLEGSNDDLPAASDDSNEAGAARAKAALEQALRTEGSSEGYQPTAMAAMSAMQAAQRRHRRSTDAAGNPGVIPAMTDHEHMQNMARGRARKEGFGEEVDAIVEAEQREEKRRAIEEAERRERHRIAQIRDEAGLQANRETESSAVNARGAYAGPVTSQKHAAEGESSSLVPVVKRETFSQPSASSIYTGDMSPEAQRAFEAQRGGNAEERQKSMTALAEATRYRGPMPEIRLSVPDFVKRGIENRPDVVRARKKAEAQKAAQRRRAETQKLVEAARVVSADGYKGPVGGADFGQYVGPIPVAMDRQPKR